MTRHALAPALVMLLAGALALGACDTHPAASPSDPVPETPATGAATSTSTATGGNAPLAPATSAPPLSPDERTASNEPAWGTGEQGQEASAGSQLVITDMRVGSHDDYSRIVLEFEGEGTPGWNAPQWDVDASTMGKGDPITVKGDHTLVIHGTGKASIQPTGQGSGQQRLDLDKGDGDEGDEGIEEAFVDPGFEGEFQVVLGTDSQTYRVFTLSDPTRLVIDVADDDQQGQDGQGDQDHHDDDNS